MDEKILNEGIQEQLIETPSFLSMRSSDPNAGIATAACDPYCMAGCESGSSCENYCEPVDEDGGCTFCESYCELYGGQCSSCESYC